jgi:hypothetical protein
MSDTATVETEEAPGLSADEEKQLLALLQRAPAMRANTGPSLWAPGDAHFTWEDFERESPGAQAAAASQAQELAQALQEVDDLRKALALAKQQQDPAVRAAELREELAALEAAAPAPAEDGAVAQPEAAAPVA